MNHEPFGGLWTALVTPFEEGDGVQNDIDYTALTGLIERQIQGGVDGILLLGTTAENPTLTREEGYDIVTFAIEKIRARTNVMVNIGNYSTGDSLENLRQYDRVDGIDAYLIVNPYYNKPTQEGLYRHFTTLADATRRPVFLYNIRGRTCVNLETDTLRRIVDHSPNVVGVKEASGDLAQMQEVIQCMPTDFTVLSGDDSLTYDLTQIEGDGVISVTSNCLPGEMKEFVDECLERTQKAQELNIKYRELFANMFLQTNPLPAKTYLAHKGLIHETFRLPMCPMDMAKREEFLDFIAQNEY
ncbi:MAG: 4-hydroxy-tetrahydrodipicolinate synthase [Candidatus Gracilibacteria bacterium]|nr:4-hydroxy-tetrahydrodipicolinate synthase [Candidatus Gracilibacteria bacterium]